MFVFKGRCHKKSMPQKTTKKLRRKRLFLSHSPLAPRSSIAFLAVSLPKVLKNITKTPKGKQIKKAGGGIGARYAAFFMAGASLGAAG
jgi:hypothetical protein